MKSLETSNQRVIMHVKIPWKRVLFWHLSCFSYSHFLISEADTHWCSLSGRELISIGKCCLLIFLAEVGASFIWGEKGMSIFSDSLNRFLGLREAAARLWGILCVSPGCGLQVWSLWAELCLGGERALSCGGLSLPVCPEEVTKHHLTGPLWHTNSSDGDCSLRCGLLFCFGN